MPAKAKRGQKLVVLPALTEIKVALYQSMWAKNFTKAAIACVLHKHPPQIDRLLDVHHGATVSQLEQALKLKVAGRILSVEPEKEHRNAA